MKKSKGGGPTKDNWERTESSPSLDLEQINLIIKPAFPNKRVTASERIGTGLSNANYKIFLEGYSEPFVLRLYRGNNGIPDKEINIAKLVRRTIPIADFIFADTICKTYDKPWAILEWKQGMLLSEVLRRGSHQDVASAASSVGKVLADIHQHTFTQSGFFGEHLTVSDPIQMGGQQFRSFIEEFLDDQCGVLLGEDLSQKLCSFCQTNSAILSEISEPPALVHSDFNGLNVLTLRNDTGISVSAVLDWEYAVSWSRYADIGNMLRYEKAGSLFETDFIRAYQEAGAPLAPKWRLLSRLLDLIALCDLLNNSTVNTPNRIRDLKTLIIRTIRIEP